MEMNTDHLFQIIGATYAEVVMLRAEVSRLKAKYEPQKKENVVPIKEAGDGNA